MSDYHEPIPGDPTGELDRDDPATDNSSDSPVDSDFDGDATVDVWRAEPEPPPAPEPVPGPESQAAPVSESGSAIKVSGSVPAELWSPGPRLTARVEPTRADPAPVARRSSIWVAAAIVAAAVVIAVALWLTALWLDGRTDQDQAAVAVASIAQVR